MKNRRQLTAGITAAGLGGSAIGLAEVLAIVPNEWGPGAAGLIGLGYLFWVSIGNPLIEELRALRSGVQSLTLSVEDVRGGIDGNKTWIEELRARYHDMAGNVQTLLLITPGAEVIARVREEEEVKRRERGDE